MGGATLLDTTNTRGKDEKADQASQQAIEEWDTLNIQLDGLFLLLYRPFRRTFGFVFVSVILFIIMAVAIPNTYQASIAAGEVPMPVIIPPISSLLKKTHQPSSRFRLERPQLSI